MRPSGLCSFLATGLVAARVASAQCEWPSPDGPPHVLVYPTVGDLEYPDSGVQRIRVRYDQPVRDTRLRVHIASTRAPCEMDPTACAVGESAIRFVDGASVNDCNDGLDNDNDGSTDFEDPECAGIRAWSVAVEILPCFELEAATTAGTIGDIRQNDGLRDRWFGFERTEIVDPAANEGVRGVVSAVVLSMLSPLALPPVADEIVLHLAGALDASSVPQGERTEPCPIRVRSPSEPPLLGASGPVRTQVDLAGPESAEILTCELSVEVERTFRRDLALEVRPVAPAPLAVVAHPDLADTVQALVEVPVSTAGEPFPIDLEARLVPDFEPCVSTPARCAGTERMFDFANERFGCSDGIDNDGNGLADLDDPDCAGVVGWSLVLCSPPALRLVEATTAGTVGDLWDHSPGLRSPEMSFEHTEIAPNLIGDGRDWLRSAVVLSFSRSAQTMLPPAEPSAVVRFRGELAPLSLSPGERRELPVLRIVPYEGSGIERRPLTGVTLSTPGGTLLPQFSHLQLVLIGSASQFLRADANNDGRVDLADPIWVVTTLFRGGPPPRCKAAADSNGDGGLDVSDALYTLRFVMLGGPSPPSPFPECGPRAPGDGTCAAATECR